LGQLIMAGIRGEVSITVCGQALSLAPTYRAIEAITRRLDKGTMALLVRFGAGDPRHGDIVAIVEEGLRGAGHLGANGARPLFSSEQIGEDVIERFAEYLPPVVAFLSNCNGGTGSAKKDPGQNPPAALSPSR